MFGEGLTKKMPSPLEGVEINKCQVVRERALIYHYQAVHAHQLIECQGGNVTVFV